MEEARPLLEKLGMITGWLQAVLFCTVCSKITIQLVFLLLSEVVDPRLIESGSFLPDADSYKKIDTVPIWILDLT